MKISCPVFGLKKLNLARFWRQHRLWFGLILVIGGLALISPIIKRSGLSSNGLRKGIGFKELLPTPAPYPVNRQISHPPELSAHSVVVLDVDSMVPLYEKNSRQKLFPASTTKIMTALIALENYSLDEVLTVGSSTVEGNKIGLVAGEQITVEALLSGLLIGSGNDAALVLAENFPGGVEGFVWAMNQKAAELNLLDTHFTNPMGLDQTNHFSTAHDLARLTTYALKSPVISQAVSQSELAVSDVSGSIVHELKNTNELVGQLGVKGVKTGWTQSAGECLVALVERGERRVISVILDSADRFGETKALIDWIFENFSWEEPTPATVH
jgi:D-alanyl-D-alanine carboxypeptidase (penicillin-binding protein 5/6)